MKNLFFTLAILCVSFTSAQAIFYFEVYDTPASKHHFIQRDLKDEEVAVIRYPYSSGYVRYTAESSGLGESAYRQFDYDLSNYGCAVTNGCRIRLEIISLVEGERLKNSNPELFSEKIDQGFFEKNWDRMLYLALAFVLMGFSIKFHLDKSKPLECEATSPDRGSKLWLIFIGFGVVGSVYAGYWFYQCFASSYEDAPLQFAFALTAAVCSALLGAKYYFKLEDKGA